MFCYVEIIDIRTEIVSTSPSSNKSMKLITANTPLIIPIITVWEGIAGFRRLGHTASVKIIDLFFFVFLFFVFHKTQRSTSGR